MPTQAEETQAKEFLKRAEVRTMKKDLLTLRETDALKERDKIAHIKTLEEQVEEASAAAKAMADKEKIKREEVLQKNEGQERIAEKDLKNYATEQERQQIFLFESQRFELEKQADAIDKDKDPALKLEKNKLLLQIRDWQNKLNSILDQEKKIEGEQGFVAQKAQSTTIPEERKSLEQRRWDLDKEIQDIEKKRWEAEKQLKIINDRIKQIDESLEQLVAEKNGLRDKILGIDKSIRDIYSGVMSRVEEKRRSEEELKKIAGTEAAKVRSAEKEKIQRQQWSQTSADRQTKDEGYLSKAPSAIKEKLEKSSEKEEKQRTQFLHDVEIMSGDKKEEIPPVPHKK